MMASAKSLAKNFPGEFQVADFGCSHGKNSMRCINSALDGYREARSTDSLSYPASTEELFVTVYFNDLPTNDFSEVFKCLDDKEISITENSLFKSNPLNSLSTCINGKSFYTRCFPKAHLHLAYSFFCLHWMDRPIPLANSIVTKSPHVTLDEATQLAQAAHSELVKFIKLRSDELKLGGRLVITIPKDSEMLALVDQHWKAYLSLNDLRTTQFSSVLIPSYHRSDREIRAALRSVSANMKPVFVSSCGNSGARFEVATLRSATFNVLLKGILDAQVFDTKVESVAFAEGFYRYLEPRWVNVRNETHLIVLERI